MSELILYQTDDGKAQVKLRAEDGSAWLSQAEIAELFATTKQNVSLHIKNVLAEGELAPAATVKESLTVQTEGTRQVQRPVTLYHLDAILAVGYRVRSPRGVQFRRWASTVLKGYLLKGFALDDERLKNPDGRPDHFDEMLARIRDIRASEKRFYQKVRDLFTLAEDYRASEQETQLLFAEVQNKLFYAVTGHTAAELGAHAGLPTNVVSAQLDVLEREGLLEKSAAFGRTQYRIAEQLFRLWLQMRGSGGAVGARAH